MAQAAKATKPSVFKRIGKYFTDVRNEMKRVVWPHKQEVVNSSIVVIATLLFFVAFTFIVDAVSSWLFIDLVASIGR
ncbi:MAG TPA: preprotein translocase subunit SecE [Coriobacteriia bacterium]|nr:preprotein translocase subunit SecE [Coriobacteriia bacterium]